MKRIAHFAGLIACAVLVTFAVSPATRARAQSIAGQYLTNGQVLIGSTGATPVAGAITGAASQITVTLGAGTIALSFPTAIAQVGTIAVSSNATANVGLVLDGAYTTAQIQAKTPGAAPSLVYNVTLGNLCVSTGTTIQGYKVAGTASTTCQ